MGNLLISENKEDIVNGKALQLPTNRLTVNTNYFEELKKQITDRCRWYSGKFHVFDHEAGAGKSHFTMGVIAELVMQTDHKVLYVQKFKKDNLLEATVKIINDHAECSIAEFLESKDNKDRSSKKNEESRNKKLKAKVLVITHNMYFKVCLGKYPEIVKGRNVLILDEFPDFMERLTVKLKDIACLWENAYKFKDPLFIERLATDLRNTIIQSMTNPENSRRIPFLDFSSKMYDQYKLKLPDIIEGHFSLEETEILENILQIINYGCRYNDGALHTFNHELNFKPLENNIILDANGSFDYRYELSEDYYVHAQPKCFDYSNSTFTHYRVKTSKDALFRNINFYQKALDMLSLTFDEKILFVTDKDNKGALAKEIRKYLQAIEKTDEEIKDIEKTKVTLEHFGNLIGKNEYRGYKNVVILKTPNYSYIDYVLQCDYYKPEKHLNEDIKMFENPTVEKIRQTMIAGEIYQALKRINRDNSKNAHYFVFTSNEDVVDLVLAQFPHIKFECHDLHVDYTKPVKEKEKTEKQKEKEKKLQLLMEYLIKCKEDGRAKVSKLELRKVIGYDDKSNFGSQFLKPLEGFFNSQNMCNRNGPYIYIGLEEKSENWIAI